MAFMTPLATIADASLHMICKSEEEIPVAVCVECAEANLAYNLIATCHDVMIEKLGPDDPKLHAMCATAKRAKHCLLKARANTAAIKDSLDSLASKSCDLDEIYRHHQVIFDQTVNLVPGQFERGVIEAAAKQENVFVVPGPSETALAFVATDPPCAVGAVTGAVGAVCAVAGAAGLSLIPGKFDPKTTATFADFDPLGAGAELYSNGLDATAKLHADASAIADSTEFKMLSLRGGGALCAAAAQTSASYSQEAKAKRVWRAILAFVQKDPQEHAKLVDVMVLLQDLAYKTTAATCLHTTCIPSLRLLTAISTSVQKGDLLAFATNYAAAAQKMAQGLAPGQRAYFTITNTPSTGAGGAEAAEAAEATESAESAATAHVREPSESPRKRARTDSTSGLPGRESTVA